MFNHILNAARFWWKASAGYRLRPWKSPYLRWRMETYTGKPAATLRLRDFWALALAERSQVVRFFRWVGAMGRLAQGRKT